MHCFISHCARSRPHLFQTPQVTTGSTVTQSLLLSRNNILVFCLIIFSCDTRSLYNIYYILNASWYIGTNLWRCNSFWRKCWNSVFGVTEKPCHLFFFSFWHFLPLTIRRSTRCKPSNYASKWAFLYWGRTPNILHILLPVRKLARHFKLSLVEQNFIFPFLFFFFYHNLKTPAALWKKAPNNKWTNRNCSNAFMNVIL